MLKKYVKQLKKLGLKEIILIFPNTQLFGSRFMLITFQKRTELSVN